MRIIPLLPLFAALVPVSAMTQTPPAPDRAQAAFDKADSNRDGSLTLAEWTAAGRRERGFKMIDADGDGKVTPGELRAAMAKYGRGG